jgi:hypothetical protein
MAAFTSLPLCQLGRTGPKLPRLGLGLMGVSGIYGLQAPDNKRLPFLDEEYKRREIFWDIGRSLSCCLLT